MSGKNKTHNSIIFLTTLSVCLSLSLLGATPLVFAQVAEKSTDKNKISFLAPGEGFVFTFDLNPIIKLNKIVSQESLPIEMSGKLIPLPQELTNWEVVSSKGSPVVLDFLRKEFFPPQHLYPPVPELIFIKEEFQSVEISKDEITLVRNSIFADKSKADYVEKAYREIINYAKSPNTDKKAAGSIYITNTQIRAENNQVFIVTRLPRAAIDNSIQ